jgi:hypothetical protein
MTWRNGRVAYWFPITLVVVGSFALLIGVFVAVLSIPEVVAKGHPAINFPRQGALHVGTNTCFTCHGDRPLDWTTTLYTQKVVNPAEKPVAVANLIPGEHVQQIDANDIVEAYTTTDEIQRRENTFHQFYVIKTEDGRVLLPDQLNTDGVEAQESLAKCSTCHDHKLKPINLSAEIASTYQFTRGTLNSWPIS